MLAASSSAAVGSMRTAMRCCRVASASGSSRTAVRRSFGVRSMRRGVEAVHSFDRAVRSPSSSAAAAVAAAASSLRAFSSSFSGLCLSTQCSSMISNNLQTFSRRAFATINGVQAIELSMPSLSPTMTQGNISKWLKKEGDLVKVGDVIAEIETDKATLEFEMSEQGYIAKILRPEGSKDVKVGEIIAILVNDAAKIDKLKNYSPSQTAAAATATTPTTPSAQPAEAQQATTPSPAEPSPSAATGGRIFASPLARTTAAQLGVDIKSIREGTGPNNRIIKADVEEFAAARPPPVLPKKPAAAAAAAAMVEPISVSAGQQFIDIPLSNVRKVIASRLLESKQNIPHYYLTIDCRVDELMRVRAKLNAEGKDAFKLSVNDFIIKAAALACVKVPQANSSWMNDFIRQYNTVDMSVAVQTDSGLITPIVKNADKIGLASISNTMKQLATKARDNKLAPHEFQGGSFTISNLGMFGIKQFAAIINPPQACILAVGASEERLVPSKSSASAEKPFEVANVMTVTLSCDHRVVDGAVGAQWLQEFKRLIEDPHRMLL